MVEENGDKNLEKIEGEVPEEIKDPNIGTLKPRSLTEEMQVSYLDYAMSVIVSRALPDVRDGLKPVHRRVLYAMHSTGLHHSSRYRKSAKVVGEVIGNYHPHGDVAVYDTIVRLAQDFSMRYPLVDGQGNFGSMDGDRAAAMRYTECRMSAIAEEMLADIEKETVNWQDNYDGTLQEPLILPSRVPQLLLNGSMGIAVGMATNIPPHNLSELCRGVSYLIDNPDCDINDLMEFIKGPDFPTGGIIYDIEEIKAAYVTGKGKIVMRGRAEIEEIKRGFRIIITEIPYQVNKSTLVEKIADLVKERKIEGISDIRDESDRRGVRVVIELKSSAFPKKILNRLYELTPLQTPFHVNMLALTPDLEPMVMTLKDVLSYYIEHRKEVVVKKSKYELKKAQNRAHILEGLKVALRNIDAVIEVIKKSQTRDTAKINLKAKFNLSDRQVEAILELRLSALAALERQKIDDEYSQILKQIAFLEDLLKNPDKILQVVKDGLSEVEKKYADARRTEVIPYAIGEFKAEDLIPNQQVIVALTRGNYIKRQEVDVYHKQIRGGVGILGMSTKEEDIVDYLSCSYTHDDIYFFTNKGRIFKSKVYELPATSRQSKGTPIVNIIQLAPEEKVTSLLTVNKDKNSDGYFIMGTSQGMIKRTEIKKYDNIRKSGIIAIGLRPKDELKWVKISQGNDVVVEASEKGLSICYPESEVRVMGRSASGVIGMKIKGDEKVIAMDVIPKEVAIFEEKRSLPIPDILVVLENGFGKRTKLFHFNLQKRGGMGLKVANCTVRTGNLIGMHVTYSDLGDVVLASNKGQFIRMTLKEIKRLGRDTQGVTLMRLKKVDKVSSVALILPSVGLTLPEENTKNIENKEEKKGDSSDKEEKKGKKDKSKKDKSKKDKSKKDKIKSIKNKGITLTKAISKPKQKVYTASHYKDNSDSQSPFKVEKSIVGDEKKEKAEIKINTYKKKLDEENQKFEDEDSENYNYWGNQKKIE